MNFTNSLKKCAPTILSCLAGIGVIFTAATAVQSTPKAIKRVEKLKKENENPSKSDIFKATWTCYVPTATISIGTIVCIFAANVINHKLQASITGAYVLLEQTYGDYISKIKEKYGEEVHKDIMSEIIAERAAEVQIDTANFEESDPGFEGFIEDTVLFYDTFSNRYFEATPLQVMQAEYHLNRNFVLGMIPSVNDFYDLLGLEHTNLGETLGWTNSDGTYYWIDFNHFKMRYNDNLECYVLCCSSLTAPTPEFLEDR